MRFFNTTGPVVAADHYCVPPLDRLDRDELLRLVRAIWSTSGSSGSLHGSGRCATRIRVYAEVIPRELIWVVQEELKQEAAWYVDTDGGLDVPKLLAAFQTFFREHSEHWSQRFRYLERGRNCCRRSCTGS